MPDYSKAKIYSIKSPSTPDIYYGSTCSTLSRRWGQHKPFATNKTCASVILKLEDAFIELVENFPCINKQELHVRERFYIENNPCVNKNTPGRTRQEIIDNDNEKRKPHKKSWYQTNKELILARSKARYEANKEAIKVKMLEYYYAKKSSHGE
jgi:hypothetical protein